MGRSQRCVLSIGIFSFLCGLLMAPRLWLSFSKVPRDTNESFWHARTQIGTQAPTPYGCGEQALREERLNFSSKLEWIEAGSIAVLHVFAPSIGERRNITMVGRAVGNDALFAADVATVGAFQWRLRFGPAPFSGSYELDAVVSWVGRRFVGQRWSLPDRRDDPPLREKRRKCLALHLQGECERFGAIIFRAAVRMRVGNSDGKKRTIAETPPRCSFDSIGGHSYWQRLKNDSAGEKPLLRDPIGLNQMNGSFWEWVAPCVATQTYFDGNAAMRCLLDHGVQRVALFGDSMMVEMFHMWHQLLPRASPIRQNKVRHYRHLQFRAGPIFVSFIRGYSTFRGRSVLAGARFVAQQLFALHPQLAIGNLAVLHWQQNMEPLWRWEAHVSTFVDAVAHARFDEHAGLVFVRPTLIQMGRTQGLEPPRTDAFFAVVRRIVAKTKIRVFDPLQLSVSRREGALDGQHWACYHRYGGISMAMLQLLLQAFCS